MGRADILLQACKVLGEDRLRVAAEDTASRVVLRSRERHGRYYWPGSGDRRFALSFFAGAAGVGYTLLRLARPSHLPCVLSLEMMD
jgi:lantibiotic modifying enzyme